MIKAVVTVLTSVAASAAVLVYAAKLVLTGAKNISAFLLPVRN